MQPLVGTTQVDLRISQRRPVYPVSLQLQKFGASHVPYGVCIYNPFEVLAYLLHKAVHIQL